MKNCLIFFSLLIIAIVSCQNDKNIAVIEGQIFGKKFDSLDYTIVTNEGIYLGFRNTIPVDSNGQFNIKVPVPNGISFFTMLISRKQGTLVIERRQIYKVVFDFNKNENIFTVHGLNEEGQNYYNTLPNPAFINLSKLIKEFKTYTTAVEIAGNINARKSKEMDKFKLLLDENEISKSFYNFIEADRDCYYSSLTVAIARSRFLNLFPDDIDFYPTDLKDIWSSTYIQYPPNSEEYMSTRWWLEYVENYLFFVDCMNEEFSAESYIKLFEENKIHTHHLSIAKTHFSDDMLKFYSAYYIWNNAFQKMNEKELIALYNEFDNKFLNNIYSPYINPFIEPVREFYRKIENEKKQNIKFVDDYLQINTINECLDIFKGKPVFIDVWATWCSPCLVEFREKDKFQDLLKENGYELLYISIDKDGDDDKWKTLIDEYNLSYGFHIRASKNLFNDLIQLFGNGSSVTIPWYMIINSNGNITVKHAAKPSNIEELRVQLSNN